MLRISLFGWIIILYSAIVPLLGAEEIALVRDGRAQAEIVIAPDAPSIVKYAASELQQYIRKISGAELPIVSEPASNKTSVFIGRSAAAEKAGFNADGLREDGFRIIARDGRLALIGRDYAGQPWDSGAHPFRRAQTYNPELDLWAFGEAGSLFAVYEFLESLGVRWYMPGEIGEVIPALPTITLGLTERKVEPNYRYRNLYFTDFPRSESDSRWFRRLRCGGAAPVYANHSLNSLLSAELTKTHPDWFAMVDGKRLLEPKYNYGYVPCLAGDGFFEAVVAAARAYFDKKPQEEVFSVMPPDSFRPCTCPKCKPLLTPERGEDKGLCSDYVWDFVNRVAIEIKKTHPGKKISCCAYSRYLLPPLKISRLSDNIVIVICQSRSDMLAEKDRRQYLEIREGWKKIHPDGEFYIWEYYLANRYHRMYGLPAIFTRSIDQDLKSLKSFAQGEFVECNRGPNKTLVDPLLNNLNIYLTARLYWDPDLDATALKDEYYRVFFGPAAAEMKRFHEEAEKIWMRPGVTARERYNNMKKLVSEEDVKLLMDILTAALAKMESGVYRQRVECMLKDCEPLQSLYGAPAADRPVLDVAPAPQAEIVLDGKLEEPAWKGLKVYTLSENKTGDKPQVATRFRILRTQTDIIIGVECDEPNMVDRNWLKPKKTEDSDVLKDDVLEIFIATPVNDCYQIVVNPLGAWCDLNWDSAENFAQAVKWNSECRVAGSQNAAGWTVELAIPRMSLDKNRGLRPDAEHPWRFNLYRTRYVKGSTEYSAWSPTMSSFYRDTQMFGVLIFK